MKARQQAIVLALACACYLALIGYQAVLLLGSAEILPTALGVGLLAIPLIGAWVVVRELRFGSATQRLAIELEHEGALPVDNLPRRPSGRADAAAADEQFRKRQQEVQADPTNWRKWFYLAVAYDDAGDRRRGRGAMRHAIALHAQAPESEKQV